jgi:hypothetical protein
MVRGRYDFAVKTNDELVWSEIQGEQIAQVLVVSGSKLSIN